MVERTRSFPGTLTDEAITAMVRVIRDTFRFRGNVEVVGNAFEWFSPRNNDDIVIEARSEEGTTRLFVRQRFQNWAVLSCFHVFIPLFLSFAFLLKGVSTAAWVTLGLALTLLVAGRIGYGMATRKRIRTLEDLLDRMEETAVKLAAPVGEQDAAPATQETVKPMLDLEEGPDAGEESPRQARRRTR